MEWMEWALTLLEEDCQEPDERRNHRSLEDDVLIVVLPVTIYGLLQPLPFSRCVERWIFALIFDF